MAFKTGNNYPRAVVEKNGSGQWLGLQNLINGSGDVTYNGNVPNGYTPTLETLALVYNDTPYTNKASGNAAYSEVSGDLSYWGAGTLTVAKLKDPSFGMLLKYTGFNGIQTTNYDFSSIPDNATITNIKVGYFGYVTPIGGGDARLSINGYYIEVTYTYPVVLAVSGWNEGVIVGSDISTIPVDEELRYVAYDKDRNFLGEYRDVVSDISIKNNINQIHSTMDLQLGHNDTTDIQELAQIITEDAANNIITEDSALWLAELTTKVGVGTGTNTDTNVEIDVYAAYGEWDLWVTEDGSPITTEDNRLIIVPNGYPDGRKIFGGYISSWELEIGGSETVDPSLLSHSMELYNIMLRTQDSITPTAYLTSNSSVGMAGSLIGQTQQLAQSFTITGGTKNISSISVWMANMYNRGEDSLSYIVYAGNATSGTVVGSGSAIVKYIDGTLRETILPFDAPITMVDTQQYTIVFSTNAYYRSGGKGSNDITYPMLFAVNSSGGYSGGTGKRYDYPYFTWTDQTWDMKFQLWQQGASTTVNYYSMDPSAVLKELIKYAQKQGSRVSYTDQTIEMTGTVSTFKFNSARIDDAIMQVLKQMPSDWYIWYDAGTDQLHAHARPSTVTRTFTAGRDLVGRLKIKKSIEKLGNDGYFSGGQIGVDGSGNPINLYIHDDDSDSINNYRRGLIMLSDNRVTDLASARILLAAEIDRVKSPIYSGSATIVKNDTLQPLDVQVGELVAFGNLGSIVDGIQMQIVSKNYRGKVADIELNVLPPKIAKRVEDIRRNLQLQETAGNPSTPS